MKGVFVKDADPEIIKNLDGRNLLYKTAEYEHSYPVAGMIPAILCSQHMVWQRLQLLKTCLRIIKD